jgi:putative phosphoesterase
MTKKIKRIGFLADTHSRTADGSDLPQQVLDAFKGVDLIVHLGDVGRKGILDRMAKVAPVLVPYGENKGYVPAKNADDAPPVKLIESAGGAKVGLCFNLSQPDKKIKVEEDRVEFPPAPLADLMRRRFGQMVDVVAFGATHRQIALEQEGVLFFNPGSPTLPSDRRDDRDIGSVAVLDVSGKKPRVDLIRLTKP